MKTLSIKGIWLLLKDSAIVWDADNVGTQGAALAYCTVFSLSPLLILVIVLSSLGFGYEAASGHPVCQIRGLMGSVIINPLQKCHQRSLTREYT
jgi:membrane protein